VLFLCRRNLSLKARAPEIGETKRKLVQSPVINN